ncbi:hypothetical protein CDG76_11500 [Nostoc sp. 'Peltigera membranacea cyanobiont' 210A]|uniref:DUF3226 domain-containing protein n=1 Tax=Nostoc sp. 'Peltigera membranacea cyanobiont' 210A TaxID=2014529 RepID=UPI000B95A918|nr:DUF3226 domain-containing protein [Nostoc sp. 'Peltigera membranacea cyanobiont' 210A]OYD95565.1 hypothetical protein CDG76_11500 [Nostoc sp. 'Peltigera membranacea cyanobiont' 210A]
MAKGYVAKKLLVEGQDDLRVIPELIEKNGIPWGDKKKEAIVLIEDCGGYENIDANLISTELRASGLTHLGVIIDADEDLSVRWISIRNACLPSIPDIPEEISETGLIHVTNNGIKFGIWIMPDNQTRGMLETFLAYMIKDEAETIWQYAQEVAQEAKNKGASFKDSYLDKAKIYSWLAWQEEPGRQLHQAIKYKILNPQHPKAQTFLIWFKTLYDL